MKSKIAGKFKPILPVLALLGVVGVVAFDYLSDGCISSMGGADVCGDDAREHVYGMCVVTGACAIGMLVRLCWKRKFKCWN